MRDLVQGMVAKLEGWVAKLVARLLVMASSA
jgi:hypothetical protein